MANVTRTLIAPVKSPAAAVLLAWVVPGGGYFFLGKNTRGILVLVSVITMFLLGILMRGPLFVPQSGDMLTMLIYWGGFLAHIATGALYFLTVALGYNQPDVAGHTFDYGSKLLVGAGLLNVLAMVDVWEIAKGRKS